MAAAALLAVTAGDQALMIDVQEDAARQGLVLVTDGHELKYTPAHHIPPGWTRFAFVVKARPLDPKEPQL